MARSSPADGNNGWRGCASGFDGVVRNRGQSGPSAQQRKRNIDCLSKNVFAQSERYRLSHSDPRGPAFRPICVISLGAVT